MGTRSFQKVAFSALTLVAAVAAPFSALAQDTHMHSNGLNTIHGNPPSVTSFGFGGQPGFHGVPASVTSPNFGNTPFQFRQQFRQPFRQPFHQPPFSSQHRHRNVGFANPFYTNIVAVPYAYPVDVSDSGVDDSMEEEDYRGGPTIFDRRGPGTGEYDRPERRDRDEGYRVTAPAETAPSEPETRTGVANQPHTVLVFKDGRQLEVMNYAIVGSTLFNLSDGTTRKVALAELDLPATVKQNDDRGVDFQLPAGAKGN